MTYFKKLSNYLYRVQPSPIIVIGNQKSGTTAIASLLSSASGEPSMLDVYCRLNYELELRVLKKELSFKHFVRMNRKMFNRKIIKEPGFTFQTDQIIQCFPDAKYVFVLRDPRDNIRSILNRLNLPGNQPQLTQEQFENLPNILWEIVLEGELFGTQGSNYIETLALRWKRALEIYEQFSHQIELVQYETFLEDKEKTIISLAQKLDLPVRHDIKDSIDIQFQPKGDHTVSWSDFFGPENLLRIETICGRKMQSYQYDPTLIP